MGSAEVQIRGAKATIQGQVDIRPLSCNTDHPDICDRASRLVGIVTTQNIPLNPINDFNFAPGIVSQSSSIHTYTATGNFKLSSIEASASGALKIEVKSGNVGFETTKLVAFTTESNLIAQLRFHENLQLSIGQRLQVIITNREHQSQDVYSTILGFNT